MKRKVLITAALILMAAIAAFSAWLIFDTVKKNNKTSYEPSSINNTEDLGKVARDNAASAFSFLESKKTVMPDDIRGLCIDPMKDIDVSSGNADAVKNDINSMFDKVSAIKPNAVVVRYDQAKNYKAAGIDILGCLCETAHSNGLMVILSLENGSTKIPDGCAADAVAVEWDNKKSGDIKKYCTENDLAFGIISGEDINDNIRSSVENREADFRLVCFGSSSETGVEQKIKAWADLALKSGEKFYGMLRNDLVNTGGGWTVPNEMSLQIRMIYNNGGFSGCLMSSFKELNEDKLNMTTYLYSYYEYFNDSEYTAVDIKSFNIENGDTVVITGSSEKEYPVLYYSSATGSWTKADNRSGDFTVKIKLEKGCNTVSLKHKNAYYTYKINKAVDVITESSAVIENGKVKLSVTAYKGSEVWASLANILPVKLEMTSENGEYAVWYGEYELNDELVYLTPELVSFCGSYNGITETINCAETKKITPYDDNGKGRTVICEINKNYTETTSTEALDDSSDPTCTPQLSGAYGTVTGYLVADNHVVFINDTGMKVYADDATLILDAFTLPENSVSLEKTDVSDKTTFTFSRTYPSFVKFNLAPQDYKTGYMQRIYNIDEFTAEYVDMIFTDTSACSVKSEPDLANGNIISKIEWFTNTEKNTITLRLYLKEKGNFGGYVFAQDANGDLTVTFKNKVTALSGAVILLDAGHGGYGSPGASYNETVYEKDITLSVAKKAAEMLEKYGATVIMTRIDDRPVFMQERVDLIRSKQPDVAVSIHCDGAGPEMVGTHTFYYKSYSMPLASAIHEQIVTAYRNYYYTDPDSGEYKKLDLGIKFFPYMIARVEECPSVLVECGYMSNASNAAFLADDNGQLVIATAISQGIVDYFENK